MIGYTWKAIVEGQEMEMEFIPKFWNIDPAEYAIKNPGSDTAICGVIFDMKKTLVRQIFFNIDKMKDIVYLRRLEPPKHINKPFYRKAIKIGDGSFYVPTDDISKAEKYFEGRPESLLVLPFYGYTHCAVSPADLLDVTR